MGKYFMFALIGLWVVLTIKVLMPTQAPEPVTPQRLCMDTHKGIISCDGEIFIKPQGDDDGHKWVSNNYNEAQIRFIACGFRSDGTFFCVNTKTGQVWTPAKRGLIV
jgi:hypothetical protein